MTEEIPSTGPVARLLLDWSDGDERARDEMLPVVYDELRRLAALYLLRKRHDHTLQPTALVHEAYLRLIDRRQVNWKNRAQFVGFAAVMMRRILVNHARDRAAGKRERRSAEGSAQGIAGRRPRPRRPGRRRVDAPIPGSASPSGGGTQGSAGHSIALRTHRSGRIVDLRVVTEGIRPWPRVKRRVLRGFGYWYCSQ